MKTSGKTTDLELVMFLKTKVNVVSGIVVGTLAIMAAKEICEERKKYKCPTVPPKFED